MLIKFRDGTYCPIIGVEITNSNIDTYIEYWDTHYSFVGKDSISIKELSEDCNFFNAINLQEIIYEELC